MKNNISVDIFGKIVCDVRNLLYAAFGSIINACFVEYFEILEKIALKMTNG